MASLFRTPFCPFQGVNSELKTKNPVVFGLSFPDPHLTAPKLHQAPGKSTYI
jgi:hypothetical protein